MRQISDLAYVTLSNFIKFTDRHSWGFWNRAHQNDAGLDNDNKFLVHDVINADTLKLIKLALKSYPVPEEQQRYAFLPK